MLRYFLGLDLQVSRGCPYAILDVCGKTVADGWVEGDVSKRVECLSEVLMRYEPGEIAVAIDAPRIPRTSARQWFWRRKRWSGMKAAEKGAGRHCEIVVAAHNLANPQWTPASGPYPQWMQLGFVFFERIGTEYATYEVFPTASYKLLFRCDDSLEVSIRLGSLADGPKDMLDAYIAAATLREFAQGRGCEVGGGDGLGTIILPRPIQAPIQEVLTWPGG